AEYHGSDDRHERYQNDCAEQCAFEGPLRFAARTSRCMRSDARKYQESGQHDGIRVDRLSQEQEEALQQRNFHHDEAKSKRREIAEPRPASFDLKAESLQQYQW